MERCQRCGGSLVSLKTEVGGQKLTMRSCSACDVRTWEKDGRAIDLRDVLDLTEAEKVAKQAAARR